MYPVNRNPIPKPREPGQNPSPAIRRQMRGGGAMLAFDLVGATAAGANRFMRGLEVLRGGCAATL